MSVGSCEEVEGEEVGRGGAGIRMMVLIWIWVVGGVGWKGISALAWAVSASDTLSADSGWTAGKI